MSWNDKVVVVTGGGSGIGAATSTLFAAKGARVVVVDMHGAAESARRIDSTGRKVLAVQADVSSEGDVREVAKRTMEAYGRVDALINNAGIMRRHERIEDWTLEEFRRVIDINLTSMFVTAQALVPCMTSQGGGSIVNIASLGAVLPVVYSPPYTAAKAGVLALTRTLAAMLHTAGVRVNAILPSLVDTPMIQNSPARGMMPPEAVLKPENIAAAVAYVAGNDALNAGFFSVNGTAQGPRLSRVIDPPEQVEMPDQSFMVP